jgi:Peptidase family M28
LINRLSVSVCLSALFVIGLERLPQDSRRQPASSAISGMQEDAAQRISADSLRGHLSFLASDALGGRDTPSPGLDVAAEYIAAQFRRAALEPAAGNDYFQTAPGVVTVANPENFRFTLNVAGKSLDIPAARFSMSTIAPLRLADVPVVKVPFDGQLPSNLEGKVAITELPTDRDSRTASDHTFTRLAPLKPTAVIMVDRRERESSYFTRRVLREPPPLGTTWDAVGSLNRAPGVPLITIYGALPAWVLEEMGPSDTRVTLELAPPLDTKVVLRNVAGLLRGSDPTLNQSYILVTAHYDGTGPRPGATGDTIWNAANDDGSGTVAVVELASALAELKDRPRRSIVFMTYFGEEKGLRGSAYYARYPLFPLEKTIANINIEHVGRTDSTQAGDRRGTASLTGFDYSDLGALFAEAGRLSGIKVYKHETKSDPFFNGSDNLPLAEAGVVAHTICVIFDDFSDYHGPGDHWEKIDYPNLEKTVEMIATAVLLLAQREAPPQWNAANPRTERFRKAREQR